MIGGALRGSPLRSTYHTVGGRVDEVKMTRELVRLYDGVAAHVC